MAFNIRVYGLLINDRDEVLLSDEHRFGRTFTKFPGGGLEEGEGLKECLIREFQEEIAITVEVEELFYLTDFYQQSAFNPKDQIISIYYRVSADNLQKITTSKVKYDFPEGAQEVNRWVAIKDLSKEDVTFPIDKLVVEKLTKKSG